MNDDLDSKGGPPATLRISDGGTIALDRKGGPPANPTFLGVGVGCDTPSCALSPVLDVINMIRAMTPTDKTTAAIPSFHFVRLRDVEES